MLSQVITNQTFTQHQGFDLATFDDRAVTQLDLPSYRVLKSQTFLDFRTMIADEYKYEPEDVRLWVLVNRQNKTVRPDAPVTDQDPTLTMEAVRDKMASRQHDLKLYLEYIDPVTKAEWQKAHGTEPPIMVFVKNFDVAHQTLAGIGHFYVHRHMRVLDLAMMINERMRYPATTALKIYEEIKPNMIELMKMKATFLQSEIQDGDIVCFQVDMAEKECVAQHAGAASERTNPTRLPGCKTSTSRACSRPRSSSTTSSSTASSSPSSPSTRTRTRSTSLSSCSARRTRTTRCVSSRTVSLDSTLMPLVQMAAKVGEFLKHEPLKLRFTQPNGQNGAPKQIIRRQNNLTVAELIQPSYMSTTLNLLYYELLDVSIVELETKKSLKVTWVGANNKEDVRLPFTILVAEPITDPQPCTGHPLVPAPEDDADVRGRRGALAQIGRAHV